MPYNMMHIFLFACVEMRWVIPPGARRGDNISHTLHNLHKPSSLPLTPWSSKQHIMPMSERSTGSSYLEDNPYYIARQRRLGPPIRSRDATRDYAQGRQCTFCGRKTPRQISWSNPNPGRRYDSCSRPKVNHHILGASKSPFLGV